ncbi:MAG: 3'-5' exonuclease, partial [Treponemataceae bacterium]|nr:3'-5' exonuclease [Treponemataceae bacterium]
ATTLRLMRATVRKSMILTYDKEQAVFQPSCIWNRAGIDISRNLVNLNINFRSTNQINEVAEKYRATIKGADKENMPETFRLGPPVELHDNKTPEDSFTQIISTVKMCINSLNYKPEDICIIASSYEDLNELSEKLKNELNLDSAYVNDSEFDFSEEGIIRLAKTQDCKGLDFPIVLFYLNDFVPFSQFGIKQFDNATIDKMNRNMIYTAITRSIEMLHIFTLEDSTANAINDLKEILKND